MSMSEREALRRWQHAGLNCATVNSGIGFVNGYVQLPEGHVGRNASYNEINRTVSVHGALTYGPDEDGWVGFDTGHSGDHWPGMDSRVPSFGPVERLWSTERLEAEVQSLAEQLSAMTEIADPENYWDCTEDEFQALLRDAKAWRAMQAEVTT